MNRRHFITSSTLASSSTLLARNNRSPSTKKGWCGSNAKHHKLFGTHWYYNWSPNGPANDPSFIPMLKGKRQMAAGGLNKLKSFPNPTHILGYNEPERERQGNLSLQEALDFWPQLQAVAEAKGARLGSPAPSSDQGGMNWLDEFMIQAKRRKLKVDFIAIHYYRSRNSDDLEDFIKDLARDYRLPIWLTEFNGWSGPRDEHEEFLEESLKFLEKERKVERYAYFDPGPGKPHSLFNQDGSLSSLGELYRKAGAD